MSHSSKPRRGSALFLVLIMIGALGALAVSAIILTGNATLVGQSYEKEAALRYAAETGLAIGKARLNYDPAALPDTGYVRLLNSQTITGADAKQVGGVAVTVYLGPSGSTTGQFGRFASLVAEARDARGTGFVRRLELTQESFAKYAYWSDKEENGGGTIYFGGGDHLWGPVWSNDDISINSGGASFHDEVGTAGTINGKSYGTFYKGSKTNQKKITLPSNSKLSKLSGYADPAGLRFAGTAGAGVGFVKTRLEFVAVDLNADGDSTDADEGFVKFYTSTSTDWLRSDWPGYSDKTRITQCGDFHPVGSASTLKFFPVSVHNTTWFYNLMTKTYGSGGGNMSSGTATAEQGASVKVIMQHTGARCYPGGASQLAATARNSTLYPSSADRQLGGDESTFSPVDAFGSWTFYTNTPDARLSARRADAKYLVPLHRSLNANSKGVIYVDGSVAVSGVVRGKVTLYATGAVALVDDLRYSTDPGVGTCNDILGIISGTDIQIADNSINTPQTIAGGSPPTYRAMDDSKDFYLHAIMMALNTSFGVENYNQGVDDFNDCDTSNNGRGCLYLAGGVIQLERGAVGTSGGTGFTKRYSYDRCAIMSPPPYFPTTGRFNDSRYYELDPVGFNVAALFKAITPDK
jgi:hypothetical protein